MVKLISPQFNRIYNEGNLDKTELHVIIKNDWIVERVIPRLPLDYVRDFFGSPFIIHAFSFLNNKEKNFSREIHRDQRFFCPTPIMLNMIVMLDDFTEANGATWIAHDSRHKPDEDEFKMYARQWTGIAGDIILFDGNHWHRSGINKTGKDRRCYAITFTKSCMKQLIDYPKILGSMCPDQYKQILGYDSRVPASLAEWEGERTYKKDQD